MSYLLLKLYVQFQTIFIHKLNSKWLPWIFPVRFCLLLLKLYPFYDVKYQSESNYRMKLNIKSPLHCAINGEIFPFSYANRCTRKRSIIFILIVYTYKKSTIASEYVTWSEVSEKITNYADIKANKTSISIPL